jgi:hypothetical protein
VFFQEDAAFCLFLNVADLYSLSLDLDQGFLVNPNPEPDPGFWVGQKSKKFSS